PALQELADLAADHGDRLQQALLGLARLAARKIQHADRAAARDDREDERGMDADLARADLGRALRRARIADHVGRPDGPAGLPGETGQADPGAIDDIAGKDEKSLDRRLGHAPALGEPQHVRLLVDAEVPAAIPVFGLAHGAEHRLQARGDAVGVRQDAGHRMLELAQLLGTPALGDVGRDAVVAPEGARRVEDGLAAHPDPHLAPGGVIAAQLEVAERLARLEQRAVRRPVRFAHVDVTELPALLAANGFSAPLLE